MQFVYEMTLRTFANVLTQTLPATVAGIELFFNYLGSTNVLYSSVVLTICNLPRCS